MVDYHVLSMDKVGGEVTVHPVALKVSDVPWATKKMWAPDAAFKIASHYFISRLPRIKRIFLESV